MQPRWRQRQICGVYENDATQALMPGRLARGPALRSDGRAARRTERVRSGSDRDIFAMQLRRISAPFRNDSVGPCHDVSGMLIIWRSPLRATKQTESRPLLTLIAPGAFFIFIWCWFDPASLACKSCPQVLLLLVFCRQRKAGCFNRTGWTRFLPAPCAAPPPQAIRRPKSHECFSQRARRPSARSYR